MNNFITHSYSRNVLFPLVLGITIVGAGSVSTLLFICAAFYLIFLNPVSSVREIFAASIRMFQQLPVLWVMPFFVLVVAISTILSTDLMAAVKLIVSYAHFLFIVPMAIGLVRISPDVNFFAIFVRGCRWGLIFVLPLAIFQVTFLQLRSEGFSGNAIVFATICVIASGISLLQSNEDTELPFLLNYGPAISGFVAFMLTFSRGAIVVSGFVGVLLICYLSRRQFGLPRLLRFALVSLLISTLLGLVLMQNSYVKKSFNERIIRPVIQFQVSKITDRSFRKRIEMQTNGYRAFLEKPFAGHGLSNIMEVTNNNSIANYGYTHLHNDYLTHAVGGGIGLLFLFIWMLALPVQIALREFEKARSREIRYFAAIVSLGLALSALYGVVFRHDIVTTFYSSCMLIILATYLQRKSGFENNRIPNFSIIMKGEDPFGKDVVN
ncbi:MAG: O-antigen ligase family protein [Hyphomicrobiales bacterium]|nr:O-antigen ligase family protein [Hyphomicrobiales bacterium]